MPWLVVFTASLYFFFEFIQLNMFNALQDAFYQTFNIDALMMSKLWFCYNLANVLFLFPAGIILDRVSTRRLIIVAMSVSVVCTFGLTQATQAWQLGLLRFVTGIASSFCLLSCVRLASRWFPPRRMALVVGSVVTFAMMGGLLAQTPFTLLIEHIGWRPTIMLDTVAGLVMLVAIVWFVRDYPQQSAKNIHAQKNALQAAGFWRSLLSVVTNIQNWLGGIYASLMNIPIFILGSLWGMQYLEQARGLVPEQASIVTSMIFIGTMLGSPAIGWFSDYVLQRRLPMWLGAITSLVPVSIIIYMPTLSVLSLAILFFVLGFLISSQVITYPLIAESNPAQLTGTAEGLSAIIIMGGGFMSPMFAWLLNWHWSHNVVHHIPIYSAHDYHAALNILPIGFLVALLAAILIHETHCKAYQAEKPEQTFVGAAS